MKFLEVNIGLILFFPYFSNAPPAQNIQNQGTAVEKNPQRDGKLFIQHLCVSIPIKIILFY